MQILVPIKRVPDSNSRIRVNADNSGLELEQVKFSINPFDEIALEAAIKAKEAGMADKVTAITIGGSKNDDILRHALAFGVDEAVRIESDKKISSLDVAKTLFEYDKQNRSDLILLGKQGIDDDAGHVGGMLAALKNIDYVNSAQKLEINSSSVVAEVEHDSLTYKFEQPYPVIATVDLPVAAPRRIPLPKIMQAKSKPITKIALNSLISVSGNRISQVKVEAPNVRANPKELNSIDELVSAIKGAV